MFNDDIFNVAHLHTGYNKEHQWNGMAHMTHHQEHLSCHPIQLKCPEALFSADLGANISVFFF